jgi:hypothetical protein
MMHIDCKSSVTAEPGDFLTAADVQAWIADIPARAAHLSPILRDFGTQRDPVVTLVGLLAKWTEER